MKRFDGRGGESSNLIWKQKGKGLAR